MLVNSPTKWALAFLGATASGLVADGLVHFANQDLPFMADFLGGVAFHGIFVWVGVELAPRQSRKALPVVAAVSVALAAAMTIGTVLYAPNEPAWADYAIGLGRLVGVGLGAVISGRMKLTQRSQ